MCSLVDITGKTYNRLTAVKRVENSKANRTRWLFKCSCGNDYVAETNHVRRGIIKSCGCIKADTYTHDGIKKIILSQILKTKTGCWEWQGDRNKNGYGRIVRHRKSILVHRLAYEIFIEKIPKGLLILHKCDNPSCINPEHLYAGTVKDNTRDKVVHGRLLFGENHANSKLTIPQVAEIRQQLTAGVGQLSLAKKYNVSRSAICSIKNGYTWRRWLEQEAQHD